MSRGAVAQTGRLRGIRGKLLLLASTIGVIGALLGAAELFCRWTIPAPPNVIHWDQFRWGAGPCYRTELSIRGRVLAKVEPAQGPWFTMHSALPSRLPLARTPGVARIAVLGESSGEMLEVSLATMASEAVEVLRCAVPGGDTALVLDRAPEVVGYRPDALVLAMGHNTRWRLRRDPTARWLSLLREHSRLAVALSHVRTVEQPPPDPDERLRFLADSLRRFERQTRSSNVRGIYVILPSNLRFAPTTDARGERSVDVFEARLAWWGGRRDEAIGRLALLADRSDIPQWHFELGDWLLARGDDARARAHLVRARDLDGMRSRTTSQINDILRAAATRSGGVVYDLEALVNAHAPHGVAGWESILDNCHPTQFVLERATQDILQLGACPATERSCHAGQPHDGSVPSNATRWELGAGGYNNRGDHPREQIARGLQDVLRQFLLSDEMYRATWALNLEHAIGSWGRELGAPGMRELVDAALVGDGVRRADPTRRDDAATAMAAGLDRLGDHDGARGVLRDVLARGLSANGWMLAGRLAVEAGRREDAVAAFSRAASLDRSRVDAPYYAARLAGQR
jgi:tetratricopeptide (TPR) repeat protein